jgi:hypothetical protein
VNEIGDHPEINLAKFGYILDMKVRKGKRENPSMFLTNLLEPYHSKKAGDLKKSFLRNLANLDHVFHEKSIIYVHRNHIFQVEFWRKFASKTNAVNRQSTTHAGRDLEKPYNRILCI